MAPLVSPVFASHFLPSLQAARNEDYLCDCRLVVGIGSGEGGPTLDDKQTRQATLEFPAHRVILAASSPFFKELFRLKRHESVTTVNLSNCSAASVEVVLHFLYSGELQLGPSLDPRSVLDVARIFQISSLQTLLEGGMSEAVGPSPEGKRRHPPSEARPEEESLLKRFCGKAGGFCLPTTTNSGSDLSVAYGARESEPSGPTPPALQPPFLPNELITAQRMLHEQLGLPEPALLQNPLQAFGEALLSLQASQASLGESGASMSVEAGSVRPGYFGPIIPTRPHSTCCHTSNGGGSNSSSERGPGASPEGVVAGDSGIMVPSNDKEGWCRNKKYIQKVGNGFKCTVCNKVYGRYNSVSYHVTIYHRNPPIRCDEPGCQFTTREARYIHFHKYYRHGTALPETIDLGSRSCPFCRHVAKSPAMLEKHVARHLPAGSVGLKSPGPQAPMVRSIPSSPARSGGAEEEDEKSLHGCDQCSYKGQTEATLHQHKLFKHSRALFGHKFTCDLCGYNSATKENLSAHQRRHHLILSPKMEEPEHSPASSLGKKEEEDELLVVDEDVSGEGESVALAPPPSTASSTHRQGSTTGEGSVSPGSSSTDLDDSHSKLLVSEDLGRPARFTTTVNYGTL